MKIMAPDPNLLQPQGAQGLGTPAPKEDFGSLLKNMVGEADKMQHDADQKVTGSLLGKEDLHEAMLSLEKANLGIKLLIQVRNKMITAYDELMKMPL